MTSSGAVAIGPWIAMAALVAHLGPVAGVLTVALALLGLFRPWAAPGLSR